MEHRTSFYITTAIMYPNAKPHLGFAIEEIYSDVLARYHRQKGESVLFCTGTDENAQKVALAAQKAGYTDTQLFVDEIATHVQALVPKFNLSVDDFIRTTEPRHISAVEKFWRASFAKGDIYKKSYEGLYCVGCEDFVMEKDLVEGKCPDHGSVPETIREENYFFKLSKYQDALLDYFDKNPDWIYPKTKFNEMYQFIKSGLHDFSVSRDSSKVNWGIPVPDDASQTIYVWFDALINYLTVAGYGTDEEKFATYWPADVHVIGKDINRFHTIFWPAMLLSADIELPTRVAVHGHITVDGKKMSKTLGNVVDPIAVVEKYGIDPTRYFLLREIPFDDDGDFSYEKFEDRYNADLANSLGNLVTRTSNMVEQYLAGQVDDIDIHAEFGAQISSINTLTEGIRFDKALREIWELVAYANQLVDKEEPWKLAKAGETKKLRAVLSRLVALLRLIAELLQPYIPQTSEMITKTFYGTIKKGEILFPRLDG